MTRSKIIAGAGALLAGAGISLAAGCSTAPAHHTTHMQHVVTHRELGDAYRMQYLNDVRGIHQAAAAVHGNSITQSQLNTLATAEGDMAHGMATQQWPSQAQPAVNAMALAASKVRADIQGGNSAALVQDIATESADASIVRAQLGLGR